MATLAQFTEFGLLVPRLSGDHHESIITELAQRLEFVGRVDRVDAIVHAAIAHDELASTVFDGVAFPLARGNSVRQLSFAIGLVQRPIQWLKACEPLVHTVVLIAVPASEATSYLALIQVFANFLNDKTAVATLCNAAKPAHMLAILDRVPVPTLDPAVAAVATYLSASVRR